MKAVANIIQERRLLEEVASQLRWPSPQLTSRFRMVDRPSLYCQSAVCLSGRRELLLRSGSHVGRRSAMYAALTFSRNPPSHIWQVHLERLGCLPEESVRFYVAQLSSALSYLHESHIMHRSVTPHYG